MCNTTDDIYDFEPEDFHHALEECDAMNGTLLGNHCNEHAPSADVFLMSLILMAGTFTIAYGLKEFKNTGYFPNIVSMPGACQDFLKGGGGGLT